MNVLVLYLLGLFVIGGASRAGALRHVRRPAVLGALALVVAASYLSLRVVSG